MLTKRVGILRKLPDLSFADFDRHWATGHAALVASLPGVLEYVQNPVIASWSTTPDAPAVNGMIEVWFDSSTVAAPDQHTSHEQREDEARFLEAFTAFTVTNLDSYDAEVKVWSCSTPVPTRTRSWPRSTGKRSPRPCRTRRCPNPGHA